LNFGECRLERKLTAHGEETSINVIVDAGTERVTVQRSTAKPELNFERFVEELDRFLDLAMGEEMDSIREAWTPPGVETDEEDSHLKTRREVNNSST
jgi:hypothetical protein